ncbi:alcohol dehydrogenase class IV [Advenella incenata]|uniref:Alcohol dehydrogenase class IV n=1 Tax=Advenella incenata TaxID=267800 RepID=A0A4Q7VTC6_9BURK|nr:iron-containing alcohol dehydrogenase [Advenella incenata]RZT99831.1 alcohol dehydrogenase class IV [Advenella incenata]
MEIKEDINTRSAVRQISGAVSWPGSCYWGPSAVGQIMEAAGSRLCRPLVITDPGAWRASCGVVQAALAARSIQDWAVFDGVVANPSLAEVREALQMARHAGCVSIIAVGGGSVIDVAKVVFGCLCSGLEPEELAEPHGQVWLDGPVRPDAPLLLAIPTTSGTGSESSSAALIQGDDGRKHLYRSLRTRPALVALQPDLTLNLPIRPTAQGGFDALLHALGALVNTDCNPIGKAIALQALRACMQALPLVLGEPDNLAARTQMQMGAYLAGVAIGISKVDAVHAMCTPLESVVDMTHAEVLAPVFAIVSRYTIQTHASVYANTARHLNIATTGDDHRDAMTLIERVETLARQANIALYFTHFQLTEQQAGQLATQALQSASMPLNPRSLTHEEISSLYLQMVN